MARKKISAMTAASAYTGSNEFYELVQGGNTRQGSHSLLKTYFDTLYAPVSTIITAPVGTYIQFAGAAAPTGFLACNGAAVSRTTYADLFAVISTTYGVGDGSTTFNLPDARGLVMVGAGAHGTMTRANGTAYNGGTLGASRNDQLQGHKVRVSNTPANGGVVYGYTPIDVNVYGNNTNDNTELITDGTNGTPRTGDETRPAEIAVLVCIKF